MDLLQKQITHKTFGSGVILEMMDDTITVLFAGEIGKKRFLYPEAFEHFLVMEDTDLKDGVNRDLRIKLKSNEEERQKSKLKQEAELQRAKEFEQENAASKKKPAAKSAPSAKKAVMKA